MSGSSLPPRIALLIAGVVFSLLLWQGVLQVGQEVSQGSAVIVGHGDVAGADGMIHPDVSTLTTSLRLIESVEVVYRP